MKRLALLLVISAIAGCGSVHRVGETNTYQAERCKVTLYQTKDQAAKHGLTEEVCVVDGSSSMSFDHSVEGAIKKNIGKICGCGTNKAYIQSRSNDPFGVSYVSLVGVK